MDWFAVYTAPNEERAVNARLRTRLALETFYPFERVLKTRRRAGGQKGAVRVEIEKALFPSYLFVRAPTGALRAINDDPGVARIVGICGAPLPVPDKVIEAIRTFADERGCVGQVDFTKNSTYFKGKLGDTIVFSSESSILAGVMGVISDLSRLDSQGFISAWIQILGADREVRVPVADVEEVLPRSVYAKGLLSAVAS